MVAAATDRSGATISTGPALVDANVQGAAGGELW